jgi:hypothetical protein
VGLAYKWFNAIGTVLCAIATILGLWTFASPASVLGGLGAIFVGLLGTLLLADTYPILAGKQPTGQIFKGLWVGAILFCPVCITAAFLPAFEANASGPILSRAFSITLTIVIIFMLVLSPIALSRWIRTFIRDQRKMFHND